MKIPAALVGALVGALVVAGCGAPRHPSAAPRTSTPAATSAPPTSAPAAQSSESEANRVIAWNHSTGHRLFRRLIVALDSSAAADKSAASGDIAAAASACTRLASAVTAAETEPPVPDPAAARWFTRALARFQESAADCQAGASADDGALIIKGTTAMSEGGTDLSRATAAIRALGGS